MKRWSLTLALLLAGVVLFLFLRLPLPKPLPSRGARAPRDTTPTTVALREHVPTEEEVVAAATPPPATQPPETTPPETPPLETPPVAEEPAPRREPVPAPQAPEPETLPDAIPPQPEPVTAPPGPAPESPPADRDRLVDDLEQLFGAAEPLADTAAPSSRQDDRPGETRSQYVDELKALFNEPLRSPATAAPPVVTATPRSFPATPTAVETPDALSRWQADQEALRSVAREESRDAVSAIFRLEPQDPETFRLVSRQYRMDVLLACPVLDTYAVVPHDGTFHDRRERTDGDGGWLARRYALSIRHLDLPWLEELRQRYISTRLIPADLVEASLLVPTREADAIFGRIIADCRKLGHSLEEISECHGTFERKTLPGADVWEYRVTRLVLKNRKAPPKS